MINARFWLHFDHEPALITGHRVGCGEVGGDATSAAAVPQPCRPLGFSLLLFARLPVGEGVGNLVGGL